MDFIGLLMLYFRCLSTVVHILSTLFRYCSIFKWYVLCIEKNIEGESEIEAGVPPWCRD